MGMDGDGWDGSSKSAESAVTGQSGRQKSVGDPCASSFEFECDFYVTMTYSPVAVPGWPTSERLSAQMRC